MASSLDSLARNLVGVNGMMCNKCGSQDELSHTNENYIAHANCTNCQGNSNRKLTINLIFDNLRISHMDEQFRLLLRKKVYSHEYRDNWENFKENHLPPTEVFYSKLNLSRISESIYNMLREFGPHLG